MAEQETEQPKLTPALGESGFSLNWQMIDKSGFPVQVTMRASLASEWPMVMIERKGFIELAIGAGWKFPEKAPVAPSGAGNGSVPPVPSGSAPWYWKMQGEAYALQKGRLVLVIRPGQETPEKIACPLHPGKELKRRSNDKGEAWLYHKNGDGWCNGMFERS